MIDDLIFSYPDCTVCDDGGDMTYDEGYQCLKCLTLWDRNGEHGETQE
jgi:hypothetical protein